MSFFKQVEGEAFQCSFTVSSNRFQDRKGDMVNLARRLEDILRIRGVSPAE